MKIRRRHGMYFFGEYDNDYDEQHKCSCCGRGIISIYYLEILDRFVKAGLLEKDYEPLCCFCWGVINNDKRFIFYVSERFHSNNTFSVDIKVEEDKCDTGYGSTVILKENMMKTKNGEKFTRSVLKKLYIYERYNMFEKVLEVFNKALGEHKT